MLSPLQERVVNIVQGLPQAEGFALAGGAALIVLGTVARPTHDLDSFAQQPEEVDRLLPLLEDARRQQGLTVERVQESSGFTRVVVTDQSDRTLVDLSYDTRILPTLQTTAGAVLSRDELAADKTLAVFGRAEARDFIDLQALSSHYTLAELVRLASVKDPGFDLEAFYDALGSIHRHPRAMFPVSDRATRACKSLCTNGGQRSGSRLHGPAVNAASTSEPSDGSDGVPTLG